MNYRTMFVINAIVVAVFGLLFLAAPELILSQFSVAEKYVSTILAVRFFGASMLLIAILIWFVKEINDAQIQKNLAIVLLIGAVVGFALTVFGVVSVLRSNGWALLVIYLLFALGYGYLLSGIAIVPKSKQQ